MPIEQPAAVALEEAQELEVGRGPALDRDVDVRIGGRRAASASTCASSSGVGASAPPHAAPIQPPPPPPPPPATRTAAVGLAVRVRSAICALAELVVVEPAPRRRA